MEEHDDWKLGDEGEPLTCPRCGKRNRAGLSYCTICGSPLVEGDLSSDHPGSLRTISEAMGARRMPRRARSHSLRAWTIAAGLLLAVVVGLTWLATREEPLHFEEWLPVTRATPTAPPAAAVAVATRIAPATVRPPTSTPRPLPTATEAPPEPTAVPTAVRTAVPTARRTPVRPRRAVVPPVTAPTSRPPAIVPDEEAPPIERPRVEATEKPSLGSDLQDATRAYRQAVDAHNARVDEYNTLADEVQRRNAWDDSEASVELRRRLDRARDAVESARVQAEMLRARMESVRARYR